MPKKKDNRCDAILLNAITECDCDAHRRCAQRQKGKHPSEMKGSRIKHALASICCKKGVKTDQMTWNELLEDDKEYIVCSSFCDRVKKEENDLEKKKEEEERKRKREEEEAPQPRRSLQTQGLPPEQFYLLADVVEDDEEEEEEEEEQQQEKRNEA